MENETTGADGAGPGPLGDAPFRSKAIGLSRPRGLHQLLPRYGGALLGLVLLAAGVQLASAQCAPSVTTGTIALYLPQQDCYDSDLYFAADMMKLDSFFTTFNASSGTAVVPTMVSSFTVRNNSGLLVKSGPIASWDTYPPGNFYGETPANLGQISAYSESGPAVFYASGRTSAQYYLRATNGTYNYQAVFDLDSNGKTRFYGSNGAIIIPATGGVVMDPALTGTKTSTFTQTGDLQVARTLQAGTTIYAGGRPLASNSYSAGCGSTDCFVFGSTTPGIFGLNYAFQLADNFKFYLQATTFDGITVSNLGMVNDAGSGQDLNVGLQGSLIINGNHIRSGARLDVNGFATIGTGATMSTITATGSISAPGSLTAGTGVIASSATLGAAGSLPAGNALYVVSSATVAGLIHMGRERVVNSCGAGVTTCTASCTSGKYVTGGGCSVAAVLGVAVEIGDVGDDFSWTCTSLSATTISATVYCSRGAP